MRAASLHQGVQDGRVTGVAADQAMIAEAPDIAEAGDGLRLKRRRRIFFDVCAIDGAQDTVQLAGVEADGVQRKAEVEARQVLQFDR